MTQHQGYFLVVFHASVLCKVTSWSGLWSKIFVFFFLQNAEADLSSFPSHPSHLRIIFVESFSFSDKIQHKIELNFTLKHFFTLCASLPMSDGPILNIFTCMQLLPKVTGPAY